MRQGTCADCGLTTSIRSFYLFDGKTYCEPCVWKASREAREKGEPAEYASLTDNSVCARCGISSGDNAEHPVVGELPLCPKCAEQIANWPYPTWLKASLFGLLVLLVVALFHGRKYFHAGRNMYIGERLVEEGKYAQAIPYLSESLNIAPQSDKVVLLTAKAALHVGNIGLADKALHGHSNGHFEDANDSEFLEVKAIWDRAVAAADKADRAQKLVEQDGHAAEAAQLMREAANAYPEAAQLSVAADMYQGGAAFEQKDYDQFLSIAQNEWKADPSAQNAGVLASALACKYAVTGDATYRTQSEEMLQKSQQLAQGDAEELKSFHEYEERIRYRLNTRQILDRQEYDRKFHGGQAASK